MAAVGHQWVAAPLRVRGSNAPTVLLWLVPLGMRTERDEIIEAFRSLPFTSRSIPVPGNAYNHQWRWEFEDGLVGFAKSPTRDFLGEDTARILAEHEAAASLVAHWMGWNDLVAPACVRHWPEEDRWVSVQMLWPLPTRRHDRSVEKAVESPRGVRLAVFDYVIANADRHIGNVMIEGEDLRAIDHEIAFRRVQPRVDSVFVRFNTGRPISREDERAVDRLFATADWSELRALVGSEAAGAVMDRAKQVRDDRKIPQPLLPDAIPGYDSGSPKGIAL